MQFDDSHVDDETLALLALGEPVASASDLTHLDTCARCADEVSALRDVAQLARDAGPMVPPAPHVWTQISDELGLSVAAPAAEPTPVPAPTDATVTDISARRGPRQWRLVAAAAAVGVLVGGTGVWWRTTQEAPQDIVATAALEPLPGWNATGSAVVETSSDGRRVLIVDLDKSEVSDDGFREVWLATSDVTGMISIGALDGSSGRFDLPAGLDLEEFNTIDVSQEQFDGNPAHSADSIVRGVLRA